MLNLNCKHFLIFAGTDLIEYFKSFTGRKRFYRQTHKQRSSRQTEVVWDCLESGISDKERSPTGGWAGERGDTVTVSDQLRSWGSVHLCVQTHDLTCHCLCICLFARQCRCHRVSLLEHICVSLCARVCVSLYECVFVCITQSAPYKMLQMSTTDPISSRAYTPHISAPFQSQREHLYTEI